MQGPFVQKYHTEVSDVRKELAELRRHVDKMEGSLVRDIQKLTTTNMEEARLRRLGMQEMHAKHFEDNSLLATRCEALRVDFTNEKKYIRGELQLVKDLTTDMKGDADKMQHDEHHLAELRRHVDQIEVSLGRDIQELTTNHKEEVRLRKLSMQEMYTKQHQDNSLMATRCEALRVDLTNEQKYTRSKLQPIRDNITEMSGDFEKMQQQIEQQIHGLDSQWRSAEEDRVALKKAHGEHVRHLEALCEEIANGLAELCRHVDQTEISFGHAVQVSQQQTNADIQKLMTDHKEEARVWQLSIQEMCAKYSQDNSDIATRCQTLQVDFTNEQKYTRGALQPIKDVMTTMREDTEKMQQQIQQQIHGLDSQLKSAQEERNAPQKVHDEHVVCLKALHEEIGIGLAELRRHVDQIEDSLGRDIQKLRTNHEEEIRLRQLSMQELYTKHFQDNSLMATRCEALRVDFTNEQKYTRGELKPVKELIADIKRDSTKVQQQIQQQIHGLDSQLKSAEERGALKKAHDDHLRCLHVEHGAEVAKIRNTLQRFGESAELAGLRRHIDQTVGSLGRDIQELTTNHKEEVRLRQLSMEEMYAKHFQDNSLMATRCEALRVDFTNEQHNTRSELQPITDIITDMKGDSEKMRQQIEQQIHGLESQLKSAEEDRGALKKAHGEHVRCVEMLREDIAHGLAELCRHVDQTESSLDHAFQVSQQQTSADIQKLMTNHEEEARLWQLSMQEMCIKYSQDNSEIATRFEALQVDFTNEQENKQGDLQPMKDLITNMKGDSEKMQQQIQQQTNGVDSQLQSEKENGVALKDEYGRCLETLLEEIGAELTELSRHVDKRASSLGDDIQKLTTTQISVQELCAKQTQDHSLMATRCEAARVDFTNEQKYTRGELQSVKDLITDIKRSAEETQQRIQQQIHGLDSQLKLAGEERCALKKAHDDALHRLSESSNASPDSSGRQQMDLERILQEQQTWIDSGLATVSEKIKRTEGSLREEIGNGLAGLRRHVGQVEDSLGHDIQELTANHKEEVRLRQLGMEEMYEKHFQDNSLMATRCEALGVDFSIDNLGFTPNIRDVIDVAVRQELERLHTPAVTHANLEEWRDYYSQECSAGDREFHLVTKYSMDQDDQETEDGMTSDGATSDDWTIHSLKQELAESMKRVKNLEVDLQIKDEIIQGFQVI